MRLQAVIAVAVLTGIPTQLPADELTIGRVAPKLQIATFVKGETLTEMARGKVYVVEFWGTTCGPCIRCMPHLTELQKRHQDAVFLSVAQESEEEVRRFVAKNNDKMGFRVAIGKRAMWQEWAESTGIPGIPIAFVVDATGVVAWLGHPEQLDEPLARIIAGTFDPRFDLLRLRYERAVVRACEKENARLERGNRVAVQSEKLVLAKKWKEAAELVDQALLKAPHEEVRYGMMKLQALADEPGASARAIDLAINLAAIVTAGGGRIVGKEDLDLLYIADALVNPVSGITPDPKVCDLVIILANRAGDPDLTENSRGEDTNRCSEVSMRKYAILAEAYSRKGQIENAAVFARRGLEECRHAVPAPKSDRVYFKQLVSAITRQFEDQLVRCRGVTAKPGAK